MGRQLAQQEPVTVGVVIPEQRTGVHGDNRSGVSRAPVVPSTTVLPATGDASTTVIPAAQFGYDPTPESRAVTVTVTCCGDSSTFAWYGASSQAEIVNWRTRSLGIRTPSIGTANCEWPQAANSSTSAAPTGRRRLTGIGRAPVDPGSGADNNGGVTQLFHVSSSQNRQSISKHGLDWRRMAAAPGIAGSRRPEQEGCFLCVHDWEVDWFVRMNNTGGPVDVWAVVGIDEESLVKSPEGHYFLREPIAPQRLTLVRQDVGQQEDDGSDQPVNRRARRSRAARIMRP